MKKRPKLKVNSFQRSWVSLVVIAVVFDVKARFGPRHCSSWLRPQVGHVAGHAVTITTAAPKRSLAAMVDMDSVHDGNCSCNISKIDILDIHIYKYNELFEAGTSGSTKQNSRMTMDDPRTKGGPLLNWRPRNELRLHMSMLWVPGPSQTCVQAAAPADG